MRPKLPRRFIRKSLADLEVGDVVYVVPWAMMVDEDRHCYIDETFPFREKAAGTESFCVTKRTNGYSVDLGTVFEGYKWSLEPRSTIRDGVPVTKMSGEFNHER